MFLIKYSNNEQLLLFNIRIYVNEFILQSNFDHLNRIHIISFCELLAALGITQSYKNEEKTFSPRVRFL